MSADKAVYRFSGVMKWLDPVEERSFKGKDGEENIWKDRTFCVRKKQSKYGKWSLTDLTFSAERDAVYQLESMLPGLKVIVTFSFRTVWYKDKVTGEEREFNKLICTDVFSPDDRYVNEKWWLDMHKTSSKKVKKTEEEVKDDEEVISNTEKESARTHPTDIKYDQKDFDKRVDYSHDESKPIDTSQEHKNTKPKSSSQDDLPF